MLNSDCLETLQHPVTTPFGDVMFTVVCKEFSGSPVIVIPGWGEPPEQANIFAETVSKNLRRTTIVPDYTRLCFRLRDFYAYKKQEKTQDSVCLTEHVRANAIVNFLYKYYDNSIEKFHIIAHSEGAITGILLSENLPQQTETVTLLAPAGIVKNTFYTLAKKFFYYFQHRYRQSLHNAAMHRYYTSSLRYIIRNILTLFLTAYGISKSDIITKMGTLFTRYKIPIHIIAYNNDRLFSPEMLRHYTVGAIIHNLDGTHVQNHINPEETLTIIKKIVT